MLVLHPAAPDWTMGIDSEPNSSPPLSGIADETCKWHVVLPTLLRSSGCDCVPDREDTACAGLTHPWPTACSLLSLLPNTLIPATTSFILEMLEKILPTLQGKARKPPASKPVSVVV